MSLLTQLRQFFRRGIQMTMDLPRDFAWEDKVIPITLHLASHPSQADTAAYLRFHLYDEEKGTRSNSGTERGVNYRWEMDEPIELGSGATRSVPVEMPLPFDADAIEAAAAEIEHGTSFAQKLAGRLALGALHPPTHLLWFRLAAALTPEGALFPARASGKIRCRNAQPKFSAGPLQF